MQIRVVIFSDEKGWHTRALQKEFRNRAIKTKCVDLADCFLEFKNNTSTIVIPGFGDHLPQLAIVRGIAGGSLEQITKRLAILHLLSAQGVNVVNNALAIEKSIDKGMTSFLLQKNGIPTPQFWVTESFDRAKKIIINRIRSGNKIVVKPLFGSQGQGLNLIESEKNLESYNLLKTNPKGGVFYLQQFVQVKKNLISHDYRVFVVKKTAIAAMKRIGKTWIHNKSLGAKCEKCNLTLNEYFNNEEIKLHPCGEKFFTKRKDDNLDTIISRYDKYVETTKPVLEFLSKKIRLEEIDGTLKIDLITAKIDEIINV